ncbi:MAG: methyltransferase domain-containing protein [Defluviitaleaceae bacterium]|nr:methyltransferase domain-containing protein [Defluviitaleaceae bacterium]
MKKSEYYTKIFEKNIDILKCPICHDKFHLLGASLCCKSGHTFDLSSKGSINLLYPPKKPDSIYSAELWANREAVFLAGFFEPLIREAADIIANNGLSNPTITDLGCGEGSFLREIAKRTGAKASIGIDISKEAINRAVSKSVFPAMWVVSNIAALPLADNSVDAAITMLSPSNYAECCRVVKNGGLIIKILPGKNYLAEIRAALFENEQSEDFVNTETTSLFKTVFGKVNERNISYSFEASVDMLPKIFAMTPMSEGHGYPIDLLNTTQYISADFKILCSTLIK